MVVHFYRVCSWNAIHLFKILEVLFDDIFISKFILCSNKWIRYLMGSEKAFQFFPIPLQSLNPALVEAAGFTLIAPPSVGNSVVQKWPSRLRGPASCYWTVIKFKVWNLIVKKRTYEGFPTLILWKMLDPEIRINCRRHWFYAYGQAVTIFIHT